MDGDVTVRGNHSSVDTSISDALDALSSLDGALVGHYEAAKDRWTILADLFYIKLKDSATDSQGNAFTFEPAQTLAELGGTYLVCLKQKDPVRYNRTEILGGVRYVKMKLEVTDALGNSASGDQSWLDPFIGARYQTKLSPKWLWGIRGDIGGFGIGDASDFAWNLAITGQYDLSSLWSLDLGWRWLDIDYDTGNGASKFEFDVLTQGPFTGVTYKF
jgi:opacity protein-like surface antigen